MAEMMRLRSIVTIVLVLAACAHSRRGGENDTCESDRDCKRNYRCTTMVSGEEMPRKVCGYYRDGQFIGTTTRPGRA
jgi:hypothetical protein